MDDCVARFDGCVSWAPSKLFETASSYGASFELADVETLYAWCDEGVPDTSAKWDAFHAWIRAKCAGKQGR